MDLLGTLHPFCFLSPEHLDTLIREATDCAFEDGAVIVAQGADDDHSVFVILEGRVEVVDPSGKHEPETRYIEAGQYFGERSVLFGGTRLFDIRSVGRCRCARIDGATFLSLFAKSPPFALAFSNILRDKQGIFYTFDQFMAELLHGLSRGWINVKALVAHYKALRPALHAHVNDPVTFDFGALAYAIPRLPENITTTFTFFLTDNLPVLYSEPDSVFKLVPIKARRRTVYEMLPGKSMVLLRDGLSDLVDFMSLMCLFCVEARKIRHRIGFPHLLAQVFDHLADDDVDARTCLNALPLSEDEISSFIDLWGDAAPKRLFDIMAHHEDFNIEIQKQLENYNASHSEDWTLQLAAACEVLIGVRPSQLPADLPVHIISSNTHSVTNCLSPYLAREHDAILAWGQENAPHLFEIAWKHDFDLLYALTRDYQRADHQREVVREEHERENGILRLDNSAFTGIAVELIDTAGLEGCAIDPGVSFGGGQRALIVNIDYAFGQQAEEIMACLLTLFGRNLASVNILGKAGALQGRRGDILVATSFIEQSSEQLLSIPGSNAVDTQRLAARLPDRELHEGPVLTVTGTMLQNQTLLYYYKWLWHCVGLEMEGTYYLREVIKGLDMGVSPQPVDLRFLYYVSDLPLDHTANLSGGLRIAEGLPPLYAVTREVLASIFESTRG